MYNKINITKGVKCYNENKATSVVPMYYPQEIKYDMHNNDLLPALQTSQNFLIQEMFYTTQCIGFDWMVP